MFAPNEFVRSPPECEAGARNIGWAADVALAEATQVAEAMGVEFGLQRRVLDGGLMASVASRIKLEKLLLREFSP